MGEFLARAVVALLLGISVATPVAGFVLVHLLATGHSFADASQTAVQVAARIIDGVLDQV